MNFELWNFHKQGCLPKGDAGSTNYGSREADVFCQNVDSLSGAEETNLQRLTVIADANHVAFTPNAFVKRQDVLVDEASEWILNGFVEDDPAKLLVVDEIDPYAMFIAPVGAFAVAVVEGRFGFVVKRHEPPVIKSSTIG